MANKNKKPNEREQDRGIPVQASDVEKGSKFDKLSRIPPVIKALFLKFWVVGACYFFMWMSDVSLIINNLDLLVAFGAAVGLFQNLVVAKILRGLDDGDGRHLQYLLFSKKNWYFLFCDIFYCIAIAILVMLTYAGINSVINSVNGYDASTVIFKSEPLGVGAVFALYDFIVVGIKRLIFKLLKLKNGANDDIVADDDVIIEEDK